MKRVLIALFSLSALLTLEARAAEPREVHFSLSPESVAILGHDAKTCRNGMAVWVHPTHLFLTIAQEALGEEESKYQMFLFYNYRNESLEAVKAKLLALSDENGELLADYVSSGYRPHLTLRGEPSWEFLPSELLDHAMPLPPRPSEIHCK